MMTLARVETQLRARIASIRALRWEQPSDLPGFWTVTVVPALGRPETQTAVDLDDALSCALALTPLAGRQVPLPALMVPDTSLTIGQLGAVLLDAEAHLRDIRWNPNEKAWQLAAVRRRMDAMGTAPSLQSAITTALVTLDANIAARLEVARDQAAARRRAAGGS